MRTRRDRAAGIVARSVWPNLPLGFPIAEAYRIADAVLAEVDRIPDISELIDSGGGAAAPPGPPPAPDEAASPAALPSVLPRVFLLFRTRDISGKSGTGIVAWGVEWTDKTATLRWITAHPATAVWPSVEDILAIHGHEGTTMLHWLDGAS